MADYCAFARSNYFAVHDTAKLAEDLPDGLTIVSDDTGRVAVLADNTESGWPASVLDEDTDEDVDVDVAAIIATHLRAGHVAVLVEIGWEKLRYLAGRAVAVNVAGESAAR